ncbi:MAG: protein kinase [Waddliaceae bacterium]
MSALQLSSNNSMQNASPENFVHKEANKSEIFEKTQNIASSNFKSSSNRVQEEAFAPLYPTITSPNVYYMQRVQSPTILQAQIQSIDLPKEAVLDPVEDLANRLDATMGITKLRDGVYLYKKGEVRTREVIQTDKESIGRGGAGSVHESSTNNGLVVKKFNDSNIDDVEEELNISRELDHPNLNRSHFMVIKDCNGRMKIKLVMDKAEGKTLLSMIRNNEEYDTDKLSRVLDQLKSVLCYLVENNYYWADFNVGNILLKENGDLKLIDFGAWGKHSRISKRSLLSSQIQEIDQILFKLVSISDAKNKEELLDAIRNEGEKVMVVKNPDEYLKEKLERLFMICANAL